jgi:hypothetical protein
VLIRLEGSDSVLLVYNIARRYCLCLAGRFLELEKLEPPDPSVLPFCPLRVLGVLEFLIVCVDVAHLLGALPHGSCCSFLSLELLYDDLLCLLGPLLQPCLQGTKTPGRFCKELKPELDCLNWRQFAISEYGPRKGYTGTIPTRLPRHTHASHSSQPDRKIMVHYSRTFLSSEEVTPCTVSPVFDLNSTFSKKTTNSLDRPQFYHTSHSICLAACSVFQG